MFFFPTFNRKRTFPKGYPVLVKSLKEFHFVNIGLVPADIPNLEPSGSGIRSMRSKLVQERGSPEKMRVKRAVLPLGTCIH